MLKFIIITYALSPLFTFIGEVLQSFVSKNKYINLIQLLFTHMLMCNKCNSFWFGLILTGSLWQAALLSIIIMIIVKYEGIIFNIFENLLKKVERKTE